MQLLTYAFHVFMRSECNEGFPLGIEGRWCLKNKQRYFEINLQKEYKITAASIQLGRDREKVQIVQLEARLSNRWTKCGHFEVKTFVRPPLYIYLFIYLFIL